MTVLLIVLAVVASAYWVAVSLSSIRVVQKVPLLGRLTPKVPAKWPRVSVVVPACNEADTIEPALQKRLAEVYPDIEYILVDDRSTDATGAVVDRMAARDPRVTAVHVTSLPEGWLGKLNAMNVGLAEATGEWILFSDADIHHEPEALARVVAYAEEHGLDHVALFPSIWSSTFSLDVAMNAFFRFAVSACRAWKVSDPASKVSIGGGLFALVRRSALERAGGLEPLRLEVIDDAALGQILKWSGARQAVLNGRGFVGLSWYRSLPEAVRGFEKNMFAVMRFSVLRMILAGGFILAAEVGPFVSLAFAHGWARALAAATIGLALATQIAIDRWLERPILPGLLAPLGMVILAWTAVRSMLITLVRGGIVWRGTRYPLDALRRGMRLVLA